MSDNSFIISRKDLAPIFDNPRVLQQFEEIQRAVADHVDTIGANVAATEGLAAASYVTLSPNTDLTNEFVLQVGEGLSLDAEAGVLRLTLQAPVVVGGFSVHMTAQGDSTVVLPLTGVLATREWVNSLGFTTGGAATWGAITGTLSAQSDLSAALAGKQPTGSYLVASDLAPYAPLASPTFTGTVGGITATMVGLGSVTNIAQTSVTGLTGTQSVAAFKTGLSLVKGDVGLGSVDNTADAAKAVLSATKLATARTIGMTGDVTWSSGSFDGSGNVTAAGTIASGAVTLAKQADVATGTVFYRKTAGSGPPEVQTLATLKTDLGLLPTVGLYEARGSGVPLAASFGWVNQGDATITDGTGSLIVIAPTNASTNWRLLTQTAPSAPYDLYARIKPVANAIGLAPRWTIVLRNSTSGKFFAFGNGTNSATKVMIAERWTSATSSSATSGISVPTASLSDTAAWLRLNVTSTTITAFISNNGWDWYQMAGSETITTFLSSIDQIGLGFRVDSISNHYEVSVFQTAAPT